MAAEDDWGAAPADEADDWAPVSTESREGSQVNEDEILASLADEQSPAAQDDWAPVSDLPAPEGKLMTAGREAAHAALPTVLSLPAIGAGAVAGAELGLLGGPYAPVTVPLGSLAGAALVGLGAGYVITNAQEWALDKMGMSDAPQRAANELENPKTAFLGGLVPSLAAFKVGDLAQSIGQRLMGGAIQGGLQAGQEGATEGHVDPMHVLLSTVFGMVFNTPTRFGQAALDWRPKIPGRPDKAATATVDQEKQQASASVPPNVSIGTATEKAPPNETNQTTIGNPDSAAERSERRYPKETTESNSGLNELSINGLTDEQRAAFAGSLEENAYRDFKLPETDTSSSPVQTGLLESVVLQPDKVQPPGPAPEVKPASSPVQPGTTSDVHPQLERMRIVSGENVPDGGALSADGTVFTIDSRIPRQMTVNDKALDPAAARAVQELYTQGGEAAIRAAIERKEVPPANDQEIRQLAKMQAGIPAEVAYLQEYHGFNAKDVYEYYKQLHGEPVAVETPLASAPKKPEATNLSLKDTEIAAEMSPADRAEWIRSKNQPEPKRDDPYMDNYFAGKLPVEEYTGRPLKDVTPERGVTATVNHDLGPEPSYSLDANRSAKPVSLQRPRVVEEAYAATEQHNMPKIRALLDKLANEPEKLALAARKVLEGVSNKEGKVKEGDYAAARVPSKPAEVKGLEGVTARSKADAERKSKAISSIKAAFEAHGPEHDRVPVSIDDRRALATRLSNALAAATQANGGIDPLSYKVRVKPAEYQWLRAAKAYVNGTQTQRQAAEFIAQEKLLRTGTKEDADLVRQGTRLESDIALRKTPDAEDVGVSHVEEPTPGKELDWANMTQEQLDKVATDMNKFQENLIHEQNKSEAVPAWKATEGARAETEAEKTARLRAARLAKEAGKVDTNPTEAQKEAGNYQKGHVTVQGMEITIENPKGSTRKGVGEGGKPWESTLPDHYGYIKRTEGADGDHVDVYLGPHAETSDRVYVIDQRDTTTNKFDEHKVMLGYENLEQARETYAKAFSDEQGDARVGHVKEMTVSEFKEWLKGDTKTALQDPHAAVPLERDISSFFKDESGALNVQTLNQNFKLVRSEVKKWLSKVLGQPMSDMASNVRDVLAQRAAALVQKKSSWVRQMDADATYARTKISQEDSVKFLQGLEQVDAHDPIAVRGELVSRGVSKEHHDFMTSRAPMLRDFLDHAYATEKMFGSHADYIDNYVPHIFKNTKVNGQTAQQFIQSVGPTWFQKGRHFDMIEQALKHGFELKTTNPFELVTNRLFASENMKSIVQTLYKMNHLSAAFPTQQAPGYAKMWHKVLAPDRQQWLIAPDVEPIWHNAVEARGLWDAQGMGGSAFRTWMAYKNVWIPIELGLSLFHPIHMINVALSENIARAFKEPTWLGAIKALPEAMRNTKEDLLYSLPWEKLPWVGKGGTGNYLGKQFRELGERPDHLLSPNERMLVQMANEAGFSLNMSEQLRIHGRVAFQEAMAKSQYFKALPQALRLVVEKIQKPIFEDAIPNMKAANLLRDLQSAVRRDPELLTNAVKRKRVFGAIGRQVDNRFGEMFYGSLFWNRYLKDGSIGSFLSLGWNLGQVREFGQVPQELAVSKLGRSLLGGNRASRAQMDIHEATNKSQYLTSYLMSTMGVAGLMTWALTGDVPNTGKDGSWMDWFFPREGGKNVDGSARRLTTMFNTREIPMLISHTQEQGGNVVAGLAHMIWNKMILSPITDAIQNKDYFGNQLYDPHAPWYKKALQLVDSELGKQFNPIALTGIKRVEEQGGGLGKKALAVAGFAPAAQYTMRTAMQNKIAHEFNIHGPGAVTRPYEESGTGLFQGAYRWATDNPTVAEARRAARVKLNQATQSGDSEAATKARQDMIKAGMSPTTVAKQQPGTSDVYMFSRLPLPIQKQLVHDMTPDEYRKYVSAAPPGAISGMSRVQLIKEWQSKLPSR